jgi:hypothetical protein
MVMEMINIARTMGVVNDNRVSELINKRVATRLIWIPGIKPVNNPAKIPSNIETIISINIYFLFLNFSLRNLSPKA